MNDPVARGISEFEDRHVRQIVIAHRMDDGVSTPFEFGKLHYPDAAGPRASDFSSRANTMIRCAALYSGWQADSTRRS